MKLDDKTSLHFLFIRIGDIYYVMGNTLKSLDNYYSAYTISAKYHNRKWIIKDIIRLSKLHLLTSQYNIVKRYVKRALEIAEEEDCRQEIVEGLLILANVQLFEHNYDKAILTSERILESAKDDMQLARAYIRLGKAWFYKNDYEKSLLFFENAGKLKPNKKVLFVIYMFKGLIFSRLGDKNKAILSLERANKFVDNSVYAEKILLYEKLLIYTKILANMKNLFHYTKNFIL